MKNRRMLRFIGLIALVGLPALLVQWVGVKEARATVFTEGKDIWNQSFSPAANILTSSLTPSTRGTPGDQDCTYRVLIAIAPTASDSVVYLNVGKAGNALPAQNFPINGGTPLTAGCAYNFEWNATAAFTYNFQVGTATTIGIMCVDRKVD